MTVNQRLRLAVLGIACALPMACHNYPTNSTNPAAQTSTDAKSTVTEAGNATQNTAEDAKKTTVSAVDNKVNDVKPDMPKVETQKIETSKVDSSKVTETPKIELAKADVPKPEITNKIETPKVDTSDTKPTVLPVVATPAIPLAATPKQANVKRHEGFLTDKTAQLKKGPIHLVFIGDSITDGWRGKGKATWDKFFAPYNAYNIGISGEHTEHVLWRLQNGEIDGTKPELAVMMIGTNNLAHKPMQDPADVAVGIKKLVETLKEKQPQMKILLLGVFPRAEQATDELRVKVNAVNAEISKLDDGKSVMYMDLADKFLATDGKLPKELMPDLLHPNEKGYEIWANAIAPKVNEILKDAKKIEVPLPPKDMPSVPSNDKKGLMARHDGFLKDKAAALATGPIQFLLVGDSITDGWRGNNGRAIFDDAFGKLNPYNIGIGGDRTQHVLWRLENGEVDGINPKVAMLMIGTNNLGPNPSNDEIAAGVTKCVTTLRTKLPQTKVLLLGVFPRAAKPDDNFRTRIKAINTTIMKLDDGGKTVKYLDIGDKFLDANGNLPKDIMPDALHPNGKGYKIWADAIQSTLDEMMK